MKKIALALVITLVASANVSAIGTGLTLPQQSTTEILQQQDSSK